VDAPTATTPNVRFPATTVPAELGTATTASSTRKPWLPGSTTDTAGLPATIFTDGGDADAENADARHASRDPKYAEYPTGYAPDGRVYPVAAAAAAAAATATAVWPAAAVWRWRVWDAATGRRRGRATTVKL
jgi:hypothetical protein